jgi:hypothetical protein
MTKGPKSDRAKRPIENLFRRTRASSGGRSTEWLERTFDLTKIGLRHKTAPHSLLGGLAQQLGGNRFPRAVGQRPGGRGDRYGAEPDVRTFEILPPCGGR